MLRLIPVLLIDHAGRAVKTHAFGERTYLGDPLNAIRIWSDYQVDELIVLDFEATRLGRAPNLKLFEALVQQARMPLTVGGGVSSLADIERLMFMGVERVLVGSHAVEHHEFLREASARVGASTLVLCLDFKIDEEGAPQLRTRSGTKAIERPLSEVIHELLGNEGAGEIVLHHIDGDGNHHGYEPHRVIYEQIRPLLKTQLILMGGWSWHKRFDLMSFPHCRGVATGAGFCFESDNREVLIHYAADARRLCAR